MTLSRLLNYPNEYRHPRFEEFAKQHGESRTRRWFRRPCRPLEFVNNHTAPFRSGCHLWTFAWVLEAKRVGDTEVVIYPTRENKGRLKAWFAGGHMVNVKQLSIWNPNKKCMPKGVVRLEFCQCMPVTDQ